jgi:hypothetical protein
MKVHPIGTVRQQPDGQNGISELPQRAPTASPDRLPGNQQLQRIARDGAATVTFGPFVLTTHAQLAAASHLAVTQLRLDLEDLGAYAPARTRAEEWITTLEWWQPYLVQQGDQPLTPAAAATARKYLDEVTEIRREIAAARKAALLRELRYAAAEARASAAAAEKLQPALADWLRAAYRSGKESRIRETADLIGTVTDLGMGMHLLSRRIAEGLAESAGVQLVRVSELAEALGKLNEGLAAVNLALIVFDSERKATELEEGMREIGGATGAFTALSTLLDLAPHIGLYANLYLVPMTKAIWAQLSHLVEQLHDANKEWVEVSGELMYPGVEPGPQEMSPFMVAVMRAAAVEDVPPIPQPVKKYFVEHREAIEAGAKGEVPTTGWFLRRLDMREAAEWIFHHRRELWAMFYGSTTVP